METEAPTDLEESSDQELVDLYSSYARVAVTTQMSDAQIHNASAAAFALEDRGYHEQAGIWVHASRPALRAKP